MGWARHVGRMGEIRNPYRILVRRPEGKRPHGRLRRKGCDESQRCRMWESELHASDWRQGPVASSCGHGDETYCPSM